MKKVWILAAAFAVSMVGTVQAEEEIQAKSLAELLQLVKDGKVVNQRVNEQREREFVAGKNRQQQALRDAEREQANEEARSERLCLLYTSPSPRDLSTSRMPSSA